MRIPADPVAVIDLQGQVEELNTLVEGLHHTLVVEVVENRNLVVEAVLLVGEGLHNPVVEAAPLVEEGLHNPVVVVVLLVVEAHHNLVEVVLLVVEVLHNLVEVVPLGVEVHHNPVVEVVLLVVEVLHNLVGVVLLVVGVLHNLVGVVLLVVGVLHNLVVVVAPLAGVEHHSLVGEVRHIHTPGVVDTHMVVADNLVVAVVYIHSNLCKKKGKRILFDSYILLKLIKGTIHLKYYVSRAQKNILLYLLLYITYYSTSAKLH